MAILQDVASLVRKGPELSGQLNALKLNNKSIARGAKDATFQFPCLVVDSVPFDMANTIARTFDHVYASFTQTWLSMNSMYDMTIDPTPLAYLKKIHQNIGLESSIDDMEVDDSDVNKYMEKVYDGSYKLFINESTGYGILFNMSDKNVHEMYNSNKKLLQEHLSDFDLKPIQIMTEAPSSYDFANAVLQGQMDKNDAEIRNNKMKQTEKNQAPKLLDRDIKMANDLVPFGVQVRLIAVNDKKEFVQFVDFIVGVKAVLHPITSEEAITNNSRALQNKNLVFKFLRWTTGEISLVKDLILNLNEIKADAVDRNNGKTPFFNTLKRMKNKKLGVTNFTVLHAILPNSTLVITNYEASYLLNNLAIDVKNEKIAKKLMDYMFLMAFVVIDEGSETVSILYDGDDAYQTYSLETLERDNNARSNKLSKEIGRMISH